MYIQDIIKKIMRDEGISQIKLAKLLGVSKQAVSKMLKSDDMKISTVIMILTVMGYTFRVVKAGEGDE